MSISITFRTTDNSRWGAGLGHNLTADEIDLNFWNLKEAFEAFTAPAAITIASVTRSGTDMFLVMSDNTTIGPIPLPVLAFRYLGAWQAHFAYSVLDTFFVLGRGIFTTEIAHTSGASFDPDITVAGDPALLQLFGSTGTERIIELSDVDIADSNLADNDFFVFDGGSINAWVARSVAEVQAILSVPVNLNDLADVNVPSPTSGQVLKWNGSQWAAATDNTGGGGGSGASALAGLTDVAIDSTATNGQVLTYHNGFWIAQTPSAGGSGATALAGLVDVTIDSTVHDGQVLTYSAGHWIPATPSGGGSGATAFAGLTDVAIDSTLADGDVPVWRVDSNGGHWRAEAPSSGGSFNDAGVWSGITPYSAFDVVQHDVDSVEGTKTFLCWQNVTVNGGSLNAYDPLANADFDYSLSNQLAAAKITNVGFEVAKSINDLEGKIYFEADVTLAHVNGGGYDSWGIGLVNENFVLTSGYAGSDGTGDGIMANADTTQSTIIYQNTAHSGFAGTCFQQGDRLGISFDKPNGRFWIRDVTRDSGTPHWWGANNNGSDDPTSPSTGFSIAVLAAGSHVRIAFSGYGPNGAVSSKIYSEAADYQGAIPTGYTDASGASDNSEPQNDPTHWIGT